VTKEEQSTGRVVDLTRSGQLVEAVGKYSTRGGCSLWMDVDDGWISSLCVPVKRRNIDDMHIMAMLWTPESEIENDGTSTSDVARGT
jgi:hypothetical protein